MKNTTLQSEKLEMVLTAKNDCDKISFLSRDAKLSQTKKFAPKKSSLTRQTKRDKIQKLRSRNNLRIKLVNWQQQLRDHFNFNELKSDFVENALMSKRIENRFLNLEN